MKFYNFRVSKNSKKNTPINLIMGIFNSLISDIFLMPSER